ncbi:Sugar carrier protein C [Zea mays]|uniref:Sugar transport protein 1 n=2 Tax=Zea mays TaxID=4577 RepID=K7US43_MAIZE|nr:sugar transport protein MST6 [Zea mays]AQK60515.1 Sugar transport protein 1 [Zea mays]PWZ27393.1 Sugar carrier protein C [Zea mays]|eukprot:XP_008679936.1 sugar transport protein MST6 [Zea mays]
MPGAVIVHHHTRYKTYPGEVTGIAIFSCFIASVAGCIFGYDIGLTSGLTSTEPFLVKFFPSIYEEMKRQVVVNQYCKFDSQVLTLFSSSLFLAATVATFFAGPMTRAFGRKWTLFAAASAYVVGACIGGVSVNFPMLLTGRVLVGSGVGISIQAAPLYISEVAPAQQRGMLNILFQLMITVGILTANMTNYLASKVSGGWGWRIPVTFGAIPAAVIALGALAIPDTPASLVERGDTATARKTLSQIRGVGDVREEFDDLAAASEDAKAVQCPWRELFFGGKYKPQLTFALLIPFFQQLTGINVIMFYAPVLFKTVGFKQNATLVSSVITGLVNVFSTFVAIATADKIGRRALFLQGGTQMIISQILVGTFIGLQFGMSGTGDISEQYAMCIVLFVCVYVAGFAWSWGPMGWLVPSEIYPLAVRSAAMSVTVAVNMFFTAFIGQIFLTLLCHLRFGLFYFFGAWVLLMTLFIAMLLPETKSVPVEEMAHVWKKHWFWRKFVIDTGNDARNAEMRKRIALEMS